MTMTNSQLKKRFQAEIRKQLAAYVKEAEHMEGRDYWKNYFETPDQIVEDFGIYLTNLKG